MRLTKKTVCQNRAFNINYKEESYNIQLSIYMCIVLYYRKWLQQDRLKKELLQK